MKTLSFLSFRGRICLGALALFALSANAQSGAGAGSQKAQALALARNLSANGNHAGAEKAIADANRSKPGSAAWYVETANGLAHLALDFVGRGDPAKADDLARRALQDLDQAMRKAGAGENGVVANASNLAGYIAERILGDVVSAKKNYAAALTAVPDFGPAQQALDRLSKADDAAVKKGHGQGGS